jgi:DNA ligase (NAD+)
LEDIIVNVGRTGVIKPEAVLEPVEVGGVTVSQATLHNEDYILNNDIRIGDTVVIKRAGDVIPQVVRPVPEGRPPGTAPWVMPSTCPACTRPLVRLPEEADYYCVNTECPAQFIRLLEHFAGRQAMDIEGLGSKLAVLLVEAGFIRSLADVYRLHERSGELVQMEGFAEKKVDNLLAGIEASKHRTLSRLLFGSGCATSARRPPRFSCSTWTRWTPSVLPARRSWKRSTGSAPASPSASSTGFWWKTMSRSSKN